MLAGFGSRTTELKVGVAVGYAIPESGEEFAAVLQRADEAMSASKACLKSQSRSAGGSRSTTPLN